MLFGPTNSFGNCEKFLQGNLLLGLATFSGYKAYQYYQDLKTQETLIDDEYTEFIQPIVNSIALKEEVKSTSIDSLKGLHILKGKRLSLFKNIELVAKDYNDHKGIESGKRLVDELNNLHAEKVASITSALSLPYKIFVGYLAAVSIFSCLSH